MSGVVEWWSGGVVDEWIDVVDGGDGGVVESGMEILSSSFIGWLALVYGAVMGVVLPLYVIALADRVRRMEKGLKALHEQLEKLVWYARVRHEREERGRL